jgi:hypothetical protein
MIIAEKRCSLTIYYKLGEVIAMNHIYVRPTQETDSERLMERGK